MINKPKQGETMSDWLKRRCAEIEAQPPSPDYRHLKDNKFVKRLLEEWTEHSKIVLAIDFDDTIAPWKFKEEDDEEFMKKTIEVIQLAQKVGCFTSIWSACAPDRYDEILDYCTEVGIKVSSINENPIKLKYGNNRKMYYNHLLDDRAGLEQAVAMLDYVCLIVLDARKTTTINFDV